MVTIARACFVTFSRSLRAPVEILSKITFSAARPAKAAHISSSICSGWMINRSSGKYHAAPKDCPLGTMVTFTKGAACSNIQLTVAWPASWKAMALFSATVIILFFFSGRQLFGQQHRGSLAFLRLFSSLVRRLKQLHYKRLQCRLLKILAFVSLGNPRRGRPLV